MPKRKKAKRRKSIKAIRGSFNLPIQTAILIPSTERKTKPVTSAKFRKRVNYVRKQLSQLFGGYTSVRSTGGYTTKKGKLITEQGSIVTAYAKRADFLRKKAAWVKFVKDLQRRWTQDSMGVIIENDLKYVGWTDKAWQRRKAEIRSKPTLRAYWTRMPR